MTADATAVGGAARVRPIERELPPVIPLAMVSLALAVTGGVILAALSMSNPSLVLPTVLVVAAVVLEVAAAVMAATIRPFAWDRFRSVFLWALLAYVFQAGIIEYSFIRNDIPGGPLAVLTIGLVVFATDVPLMIAFTTARYQAVAD